MTVHKTHKDIRGIRGTQRWAPGVVGKMTREATANRGSVIAVWFRNYQIREQLTGWLETRASDLLLVNPGRQEHIPNAEAKTWVFTTPLRKNTENKILSRFCRDATALPVFLLDDSQVAAYLADVIWIVGESGEIEEEIKTADSFFC